MNPMLEKAEKETGKRLIYFCSITHEPPRW